VTFDSDSARAAVQARWANATPEEREQHANRSRRTARRRWAGASEAERAAVGRELTAARQSPDAYARRLVEAWPALSADRRAMVGALLRPIAVEIVEQSGGVG
jgi:hypothetical protein